MQWQGCSFHAKGAYHTFVLLLLLKVLLNSLATSVTPMAQYRNISY